MIEYLSGILLFREENHLVINVGGIGYGIDSTAAVIRESSPIGSAIEIHIYHYVQENLERLYGFASRDEREVFILCLNANGIGPKTALAILSTMEFPAFARAVITNDLKSLSGIPGIGKKTAERIVIELREKVQLYADVSVTTPAPASPNSPYLPTTAAADEAIQGLISLGCKPAIAERAIARAAEILGSEAPSSALLKEGLKHRY